jgi:hypothetical protein
VDIGLALPNAAPDLVIHAVVRQCQDNKRVVDDASDYQMPRPADLARGSRNAPPAVSKVVMDAASHVSDAGSFRVFKQIHQGLLDQNLVSLSAEGTEFRFTPPQDFAQLPLRGPGEQDTA